MEYRDTYGRTAISAGTPPNFDNCAAVILPRQDWTPDHQCPNRAKFDPDENGNPTTCSRHRDKQALADSQPRLLIEAKVEPIERYRATATCPECGFRTEATDSRAEWAETTALNELSTHVRGKHHRRVDRNDKGYR